jgi:hypothetical protein
MYDMEFVGARGYCLFLLQLDTEGVGSNISVRFSLLTSHVNDLSHLGRAERGKSGH